MKRVCIALLLVVGLAGCASKERLAEVNAHNKAQRDNVRAGVIAGMKQVQPLVTEKHFAECRQKLEAATWPFNSKVSGPPAPHLAYSCHAQGRSAGYFAEPRPGIGYIVPLARVSDGNKNVGFCGFAMEGKAAKLVISQVSTTTHSNHCLMLQD